MGKYFENASSRVVVMGRPSPVDISGIIASVWSQVECLSSPYIVSLEVVFLPNCHLVIIIYEPSTTNEGAILHHLPSSSVATASASSPTHRHGHRLTSPTVITYSHHSPTPPEPWFAPSCTRVKPFNLDDHQHSIILTLQHACHHLSPSPSPLHVVPITITSPSPRHPIIIPSSSHLHPIFIGCSSCRRPSHHFSTQPFTTLLLVFL